MRIILSMLLLSGFLGVVACDDTKDNPLKEVPRPPRRGLG